MCVGVTCNCLKFSSVPRNLVIGHLQPVVNEPCVQHNNTTSYAHSILVLCLCEQRTSWTTAELFAVFSIANQIHELSCFSPLIWSYKQWSRLEDENWPSQFPLVVDTVDLSPKHEKENSSLRMIKSESVWVVVSKYILVKFLLLPPFSNGVSDIISVTQCL